jgi:hypothetical protein
MTHKNLDQIMKTELAADQLEVLDRDKQRWKRLGASAHLRDWLDFYPGLRIRRQLAMKINFTNKPEGRGYVQDYGAMLALAGFDTKDRRLMTTLTAVLWIEDSPEHVQTMRDILDTLSPGERSRINSPISMRQRIEKVLYADKDGKKEKTASPIAILKNQLAEAGRKIAHLEERLAAAEHVHEAFSLEKDSAEQIADVLIGNVGMKGFPRKKLVEISNRLAEHLGTKVKKPKGKTAGAADDVIEAEA